MIATSFEFWRAFFDPGDPHHAKARADIRVYDREKIILSPFIVAEVASWLIEKGKIRQKNWFLDFARNTANARVFIFGKEEFEMIMKIALEENMSLEKASLEYLRRSLNCDITDY
ncbi:MAG: hypothetical protein U0R44_01235 [Candidatus Micrarchaeia archaeon]